MTLSKITIVALAAIMMTACGSSKKSSAPSAAAPSIIPGEAQLTAIKAKYPDATAEQLKQGHSIYIGACTNCHGQKNIFKRSEASWLHEIDDMSPKAKLTAVEKDALTKYILAMKATQAPEVK
jgi:mono/diheme cytochrome c family protein